MDQDSPDEFISENDYRYLLNARNKYGRIVNLKGNTDVSNYIFHSGQSTHNPVIKTSIGDTLKVIGSCKDLKNNAIVYFVYCSDISLNSIFRLYTDSYYVEKILDGSVLNFELSYNIDANIIDGYLFWTDNYNPPRVININKAVDMNLTAYSLSEYYIYGEIVSYSNSVWKCISSSEISGITPTDGSYWSELRTVDAYTSIDSQMLEVIKYAPAFSIELYYITNTGKNYNYLKSKVLQFSYRYVYEDNGKSVLAPYSKLEIPSNEIYTNNESNLDIKHNNGLILTYKFGHKLVKKIELLVREGNTGSWFLYDYIDLVDSDGDYTVTKTFGALYDSGDTTVTLSNINNADWLKAGMYIQYGSDFSSGTYIVSVGSSTIVVSSAPLATQDPAINIEIIAYPEGWVAYSFYNDKSFIAQDEDDLARPFDYVPKKAFAQDIIDKSRLVYANYTQGFDNVDINVGISRSNVAIDSLGTLFDSTKVTATYGGVYTVDSVDLGMYYTIANPSSVTADSYLSIIIKLYKEDNEGNVAVNRYFPFKILLTSTDVVDTASIMSKIVDVIKINDNVYPGIPTIDDIISNDYNIAYDSDVNQIIILKYVYNPVSGEITETIDNTNITFDIWIDSYMPVYKTWKDGDLSFGIEYADESGRYGNVNTNDSGSLSIPTVPERNIDGEGNAEYPYMYTKVSWNVKHRPPSWAYYWRWVVYNNVSDYTQFKFKTYRVDGGKIRIWFNEFIQEWNNNNGSGLSEYVYQSGDRFRILAYKTSSGLWTSLLEILDGEIIGGENNDDGNYEIIVDNMTNIVDYNSYTYLLGEVYTPSKSISEKVYKEIGKTYEIGNAGTSNAYHKSDTTLGGLFINQSADLVTYATGYFMSGNAYMGYRNDMNEAFPCIRDSISDIYDSGSCDFGRLNVVDKDAEEKVYSTRIIYGGKYISNTFINYISKFEYDNYVELNEKHGSIISINEIGGTLKVLQQNKENSIYIGRRELKQANGSDVVVASNSVLGTISVYPDDYGCKHFNSIVVHNRGLYYFDIDSGVVIRSTPNGQVQISKYGFESWFKTKCTELKQSGSTISIFATFIDEYNEYILCMVNGNDVSCLVFNEDKNKWTHWLTMLKEDGTTKVEHLIGMEQRLYSFIDGISYRHEDNSTYNYLFGEQRRETIQFIANKEALNNKVFENITIHTDNNRYNKSDDSVNWSIPTIIIPSSGMYPSGMSSRLTAKYLQAKEGKLHSEFLRDLNSPDKTGKDALLNGRVLRGKVIDITMQNDNTEKVNLISVVVDSTLSELNNS